MASSMIGFLSSGDVTTAYIYWKKATFSKIISIKSVLRVRLSIIHRPGIDNLVPGNPGRSAHVEHGLLGPKIYDRRMVVVNPIEDKPFTNYFTCQLRTRKGISQSHYVYVNGPERGYDFLGSFDSLTVDVLECV
jgi:hypothetical protein